tara:strand:- start:130 stop:546 length:417 start_codon:yes stop_codon:yes gene_type:complete
MLTVYCDGTFDLLHTGHVDFLKKCKQFGNFLIVGVISDKNVESYKRIPIIDLDDRSYLLENLSIVDKVIKNCPFNNLTREFIDRYNIDIVVYASDILDSTNSWSNHYKVPIEMGIMKFIEYDKTKISSTKIINSILTR